MTRTGALVVSAEGVLIDIGDRLVAHNAAFDTGFIRDACAVAGRFRPDRRWLTGNGCGPGPGWCMIRLTMSLSFRSMCMRWRPRRAEDGV